MSENSEINVNQFTDSHPAKQVRTAGDNEAKQVNGRRRSSKAKKKSKLRETLVKSTRRE